MTSYIISPLASRDLDDIFDYFAEFSVDAGERFVDEFNKKCCNLVAFPHIGRVYIDMEPSLRGIPLSGYVILYRVNDNSIEIVRVVSGYRDLDSLFRGSSDIN